MAISQSITVLPTPPSRADPDNFDARADAFLGALPTMQTQMNTWAGQANTTAAEIGIVSEGLLSVTPGANKVPQADGDGELDLGWLDLTGYAPAAQGVTNGNSHDHNGGDGAQIAYANLSGLPTLGTAAAKNIPATGNASATEVVYGSDTRLSDARTPASHTTGSHSDWPAGVSMTELGYLDGVTSAVQTQINSRAEVLTADRDYYVRTDGSDSNTGLANTSGGAFLTLQYACDVASQIAGGRYKININIADGTYTCNAVTLRNHLSYQINIIGNTTTPTNVVLQAPGWNAITSYARRWTLAGVKIELTSDCWAAIYVNIGDLTLDKCTFAMAGGYSAAFRLYAYGICIATNIIISGNFESFCQAYTRSLILFENSSLTVNGNVTMSGPFVYASNHASLGFHGTTITAAGTITGKRYDASELALIDGNGSSTYFPGNVAGTTATGAQYV
jgi:hypothetical protein